MRLWFFIFGMLLASWGNAVELASRHHPVNIEIPQNMNLPEKMKPDEHGKLVCATCHGVENIEDLADDEINKEEAGFLHGGPWQQLDAFCVQCHDEKPMQRLNIHLQLDQNNKLLKEACTYCHIKTPDLENIPTKNELKLRLPPERICLGCHLKAPHLNVLEHNSEPDDDYKLQIQESEQELNIIMPLDSKGKITCITCHNHHQKGVIPEHLPAGNQSADRAVTDGSEYQASAWSAVFNADKKERLNERKIKGLKLFALQYQHLAGEVLIRLPAKDGTLCRACHKLDD